MSTRSFVVPFLIVAACAAQQPAAPPGKAQDPEAVIKELKASFEAEKIVYDGKAQTVTVDAVTNEPRDPIEYLLIHQRGKRHEALFVTKSKPSVLNGALLLLGLEAGKNASYKEKDPPPTLEQIEAGADPIIVTPPAGKPFWMTVAWDDKDGKRHEHCVEDLIYDIGAQKMVSKNEWVFLGGRLAPLYKGEEPVFIADIEGNLVSVCYLAPDNHLATMGHERGRSDDNWWLTDKIPEFGTAVKLTFHKNKPKLFEEREARLAKEAKEEAEKAAKEKGDKGEAGKGEAGKQDAGR